MQLWPGLGPHCYACSERASWSCCRLLRARFALSGFLAAELESCLKRLLLNLRCECRRVLLRPDGAFGVSADRDYASRAWHLELEICVVRHTLNLANAVRPSRA